MRICVFATCKTFSTISNMLSVGVFLLIQCNSITRKKKPHAFKKLVPLEKINYLSIPPEELTSPHHCLQLFESRRLHKFLTDSLSRNQNRQTSEWILFQLLFAHKSIVRHTIFTKTKQFSRSILPKVENHHKFPLFLPKVKGTSIEYWGPILRDP